MRQAKGVDMVRYLAPLGIFLVIALFLGLGLSLNPREVPSPFIDKPAPQISLPTLFDANRQVTNESLSGSVWVLNVWASWCVACRAEHELLKAFAATQTVPLVGLNYKDKPADAKKWLRDLGNPYAVIAVDFKGDTGIDWGVYGVPETFVIDQQGTVRYKHIGPLDSAAVQNDLIPLIKTLTEKSS
jgi:cytochrome c biogenesis protein CcmG, thiol:disulfide interchange protein DsbE